MTAFTPAVSDAVGVTDSGRDYAKFRNGVDPAGVTESVTALRSPGRVFSEDVGLTDAVAVVSVVATGVADVVGVPEALGLDRSGVLADSAGVTDTTSPVLSLTGSPADVVGVTDSSTTVVDRTSAVSDAAGVTDVTAAVSDRVLSSLDNVGVTDTGQSSGLGMYGMETVRVTETVATATAAVVIVPVADNVGVSGNVSPVLARSRPVVDVAGVSDAAVATLGTLRATSDNVGVSGTVAVGWGFNQPTADVVGLTDTLVQATAAGRAVADTVGVSDVVITSGNRSGVAADVVGVTDAGSTTFETLRGVDPVGVTDTVVTGFDVSTAYTDLVPAVETLLTEEEQHSDSEPPVMVTDEGMSLVYTRTGEDIVGLTDSLELDVVIGVAHERSAQEAVAVTDLNGEQQTLFIWVEDVLDPVGLTETVKSVAVHVTQVPVDNADVVDSASVVVTRGAFLQETVAPVETVSPVAAISRARVGAIPVPEVVTVVSAINPTPQDTVVVSDNISVVQDGAATSDVLVSVSDAGLAYYHFREGVETVGVSTTATAVIQRIREPADTVGVTDNVGYVRSQSTPILDSVAAVETIDFLVESGFRADVGSDILVPTSISMDRAASSTDPVAAVEQVTSKLTTTRTAAENVSVTDAVANATLQDLPYVDVRMLEAVAVAVTRVGKVSDPVGVAETVAVSVKHVAVAEDAVGVEETLGKQISLHIENDVAVDDVCNREVSYARSPLESVDLGDTLLRVNAAVRPVMESVGAAESLTLRHVVPATQDKSRFARGVLVPNYSRAKIRENESNAKILNPWET